LIKGRQRASCRAVPFAGRVLAALLATLTTFAAAHTAEPPFRFTEAAEQGTFNVGAARASVSRSLDGTAGGEVVKLDYTLPPGTAAGAWAKAFPQGLNGDTIDVVRLGVKGPGPGQPHQVVAAVEIKGTKGVQRIPLPLQPDWTSREEPVSWSKIGGVTEVVVLVNRSGGGEPVEGSLYLDLRFERLPLLRKLSTFPAARIGGTLLVALVVALLAALVNLVAGRRPRVRADAEEDFVADAERRPPSPQPLSPRGRGVGVRGPPGGAA